MVIVSGGAGFEGRNNAVMPDKGRRETDKEMMASINVLWQCVRMTQAAGCVLRHVNDARAKKSSLVFAGIASTWSK